MRWKHEPYFGHHNTSGDVKEETKFLWLPTRINNETRWLEKATIKYQYVGWRGSYYLSYYWYSVEWVNKGA